MPVKNGIFTNPARENAEVFSGMMKKSGPIVNPIMGYLAGKNLSDAQTKDVEIEQNYLGQMKTKQDQEEGQALLDIVLKMSQSDPEEATAMLQSARKTNGFIARMIPEGIKFTAKTTKEGWIHFNDAATGKEHVYNPVVFLENKNKGVADSENPGLKVFDTGLKPKDPLKPNETGLPTEKDKFEQTGKEKIKQMELDAEKNKADKGKVLTLPEVVDKLTPLYQSIRLRTKDTSITDALLQSALSNDPEAQKILASKIKASGNETDEGLAGVMQSIKFYLEKYKELSGGNSFMPKPVLPPDLAAEEARRRGLIK